jgi:hypothetical protein
MILNSTVLQTLLLSQNRDPVIINQHEEASLLIQCDTPAHVSIELLSHTHLNLYIVDIDFENSTHEYYWKIKANEHSHLHLFLLQKGVHSSHNTWDTTLFSHAHLNFNALVNSQKKPRLPTFFT